MELSKSARYCVARMAKAKVFVRNLVLRFLNPQKKLRNLGEFMKNAENYEVLLNFFFQNVITGGCGNVEQNLGKKF